MSSLQSLNSILRFRDAVLPGLPVYLTEWGWDSAGGGQSCDPPPERSTQAPFPECVSERSQALYAVRGALVLARKGLSRATWYFYANTDLTSTAWDSAGGTGVFARSGLVAVNATRFVPELAHYALQTFVALLGSARFLSAVRRRQGCVCLRSGLECRPTNLCCSLASHLGIQHRRNDGYLLVGVFRFCRAHHRLSSRRTVTCRCPVAHY